MKALDCATVLTPTTARQIKQDGYDIVCRYLGYFTHKNWGKTISPEESKAIVAAGGRVVFIWEGNPTFAGYFTFEQGVLDGGQAVHEMQQLGVSGVPVYFTVDYDAQTPDMAAIERYLQGVRKSLAGSGLQLGLYGGFKVIEAETADKYWQAAAWSGGQVSKKACMYQNKNDVLEAGTQVDVDQVFSDPGAWPLPQPKKEAPKVSEKPTLAFGTSLKSWVEVLQNDLNAKGSKPTLVVDGIFGKNTLDSVKYFQTEHHLLVDGVVGPITWGELDAPAVVQPTPAPTPAPKPPVQTPTTHREVVATLQGSVMGNTFMIQPKAKRADGTFSGFGDWLQFDTGADCLLLSKNIADAFGCVPGKQDTIQGVTGSDTAYESTITLQLGDVVYPDQFCIVEQNYQPWNDGLFGLKFFKDNKLNFEIDIDTQQLIIFKQATA